MAWYYILFFFALSIFIIKFGMTLLFGDTDIDFDADGDIDMDISTLFSFKGVLHFILGFSTYLSATARMNFNDYNAYSFDWIHYIFAIFIGLAFSICLFYLYKLVMKLNHYNNQQINLNGYKCTILVGNGIVDIPNNSHAYSYTVLVNTEIGSRKVNVLSSEKNLEIGSEHKITMLEDGTYTI